MARLCHENGVFVMGGKRPVESHDRPVVVEFAYIACPRVDHGFDGYGHARDESGFGPPDT